MPAGDFPAPVAYRPWSVMVRVSRAMARNRLLTPAIITAGGAADGIGARRAWHDAPAAGVDRGSASRSAWMAAMALPETFELDRGDGRILRYCLHGPVDGFPVVSHGGSPSSRWKWPHIVEAMEHSRLRLLVYDRPGYGGSTRQPGRGVADAADDVRALADAYGWQRFGVFGGSGGGPHALACAALLADRVTRCAVLSGIKPADPGSASRDEAALRSRLAARAAEILAGIEAGGPEVPAEPGPAARTDPDAMARIRATFVDGMDGWVDDWVAFDRPWRFEPEKITVPVGIWRGTSDTNVPGEHADWLLAHIPTAQGHVYDGGHLPRAPVYRQIYDWLCPDASRRAPA